LTQYVIEKEHIHQRLDFIEDSINEIRQEKLDRNQFYENNTTLAVQMGNIQKAIADAQKQIRLLAKNTGNSLVVG
jgi:hypothetical protein